MNKLTEKELKILAMLIDNEYGEGAGYVFYDEWPMKIYRGVLSSLVKKNIIREDDCYSTKTESWFSIIVDLEQVKEWLDSSNVEYGF